MKWEDTVIKLNCGGILSDVEVEYYNRGAEVQAEISFKAGKLEGMLLYSTWLKDKLKGKDKVSFSSDEWQAKLKEWEL